MANSPLQFRLVTSNAGKLAEWQRLLPKGVDVTTVDLDLPEIQSLDPDELIRDKARRAYEAVGGPVVVEDVWAGIDSLGGMPGPFIKFFEKQLGTDALFQLGGKDAAATVTCIVAHFDGNVLTTAVGVRYGTVVPKRGTQGFGFDCCFVPAGQPKTYGEMTTVEKDAISHRSLAVQALLEQLQANGNLS